MHVTNVTSVSHHVLIVTLYHKCHPGLFSISWVPPFITRFGIKMVRWKCYVSFDINEGKLYTPSSDGIPATETSLGTRIFLYMSMWNPGMGIGVRFYSVSNQWPLRGFKSGSETQWKTFIFCVALRKPPRLILFTVLRRDTFQSFWRHRSAVSMSQCHVCHVLFTWIYRVNPLF